MDLVEAGLLGAFFVGLTVVSLQVQNRALNSSLKKQAVQELFKTLGIKGFKPQDLNTDKLDETGFARLVTLIREVKGVASNPIAELMQLAQLGQMQNLPRGTSFGAPVIATPQTQTTTGQ